MPSRLTWWLIVSGAVLLGAIGVVIYYFVWPKSKSTKTLESLTVTRGDAAPGSALRPGDKVLLTLTGTTTRPLRWYFSKNNRKSWQAIGHTREHTFSHTLGADIFTEAGFFKVSDEKDARQFVISGVLAVTPTWYVDGPGTEGGFRLQVGSSVTYVCRTEAWGLVTTLVFEYRKHGDETWLTTTDFVVDRNNRTVVWTPPLQAALVDKAFDVRIGTTGLVAQGYPSELSFAMPHYISMVNTVSSTALGAFRSFLFLEDHDGPVRPGDFINVSWSTTTVVARVDLYYAFGNTNNPVLLQRGLDGTRQTYKFQVPDLFKTGTLYFIVQDSNEPLNKATSSGIPVELAWQTISSTEVAGVIIYNSFRVQVPVKFSSTGAYLGPSNLSLWRLKLVYANGQTETAEPTGVTALVKTDYYLLVFLYEVTPRPVRENTTQLPSSYTLGFKAELAFNTSDFSAVPVEYVGRLAAAGFLALTGEAFRSINYYPCFDELRSVEQDYLAQLPLVELPNAFRRQNYFFTYIGSYKGGDGTIFPVIWSMWQKVNNVWVEKVVSGSFDTIEGVKDYPESIYLCGNPTRLNMTKCGNNVRKIDMNIFGECASCRLQINSISTDTDGVVKVNESTAVSNEFVIGNTVALTTCPATSSATREVVPTTAVRSTRPALERRAAVLCPVWTAWAEEQNELRWFSARCDEPFYFWAADVGYSLSYRLAGSDSWLALDAPVAWSRRLLWLPPRSLIGQSIFLRLTTRNLVAHYGMASEVDVTAHEPTLILEASSNFIRTSYLRGSFCEVVGPPAADGSCRLSVDEGPEVLQDRTQLTLPTQGSSFYVTGANAYVSPSLTLRTLFLPFLVEVRGLTLIINVWHSADDRLQYRLEPTYWQVILPGQTTTVLSCNALQQDLDGVQCEVLCEKAVTVLPCAGTVKYDTFFESQIWQ